MNPVIKSETEEERRATLSAKLKEISSPILTYAENVFRRIWMDLDETQPNYTEEMLKLTDLVKFGVEGQIQSAIRDQMNLRSVVTLEVNFVKEEKTFKFDVNVALEPSAYSKKTFIESIIQATGEMEKHHE